MVKRFIFTILIYRHQLRHSSDILDILPSNGHVNCRNRSKIDEVEAGLFIGNMDAATDVVNLEIHRISHIVTVRTR